MMDSIHDFTYANIRSPRLQYAAIALAAVEKPYE